MDTNATMIFRQACDFVFSIFHDRNCLSEFFSMFSMNCALQPLKNVRPCRRYCQTSSSSARRRGDSLQPSAGDFSRHLFRRDLVGLSGKVAFATIFTFDLNKFHLFGAGGLYHKITCWLVRPIKWGFMIGFTTLLYMSTYVLHMAS